MMLRAPHPPPRQDPRAGADAQGLPRLEADNVAAALGNPRRGRPRRRRSPPRRRPGGTSPRRCWSPTTRPGAETDRRGAAARPHRPRARRRNPAPGGLRAGLAGRTTRSPAPSSSEDEDTVTRRLRAVARLPGAGDGGRASTRTSTPATRARPWACPPPTSAIRDELGPMPAWLVPAALKHLGDRRPRHQRHSAGRACGWSPTLHRAGLPTLLITYREDLGAPPSPDGFHHMGLTEWRDLAAAARYALAHGAQRLVLVGYSMGGAIVAQFMERSPLAPRVAGLVLDAPALDWKADPRLQRHRDGASRLRRAPGRVGDRRPHRRRLGQPRRDPAPRGLPAADPALPRRPTTRSCRSRPATISPRSCRAGSPTSAYPRPPTPRRGTSIRRSTKSAWARSSRDSALRRSRRSAGACPPRAARPRAGRRARAASPRRRGGRSIWTESGMPSAAKPAGTAIAGLPRWFQGTQ